MSHLTTKEKHPKHDFQVERLAFFSDAVFAIAITLLVIEFKVPHVDKNTTYVEVWQEIDELKYKFISVLLSFMFISTYWVRHHLLFKYIHDYNRQVLLCNLFVLLPIIFFPFTTAFFYDSIINHQVLPIAYRFFLVNNIIAGIMTYVLYWLVTKRYPHMSLPMEPEDKEAFTYRVLWMVAGFGCMFVLSFFSLVYSCYGLLPMFAAMLYRRFIKNKKRKHHHAG